MRADGAGAPGSTSAARRTRYRLFSVAVVVALAAINVTDHLLHPSWWVRALEGIALLAWARLDGLTWSQLGLGRDRLRAGCLWALGAIAAVGVVYVVGVLLPTFRPAFQDVRYHVPLPEALRTAFVVIPFGTVLAEELAFRSVLWGALSRHLRPWQVLVTSSVLFGFWHILPSLHIGASNRGVAEAVGGASNVLVVAGTVVFTAIGGLVFGELRRRSGSVIASMGAHWATNALGVLFGVLAWRLDPAAAAAGPPVIRRG